MNIFEKNILEGSRKPKFPGLAMAIAALEKQTLSKIKAPMISK